MKRIVMRISFIVLFVFRVAADSKLCIDSTDTFEIDGFDGKKTCAWVGRGNKAVLCDIGKVAETCPRTCNEDCSFARDTLIPCTDSSDRFYIEKRDKMKSCTWARNRNTSLRCKLTEVAQNCPGTCDTDCLRPPLSSTGCKDSPYMFRLVASLKYQTCDWAARNNTFKRCRKYPTKLWCPLTCSTCGNEPSAAPSLSLMPSKAPSRMPSTNPTLSQMPSKAPTGNPTAPPTFICEDTTIRFYVKSPVNKVKPCDPWVKNNASLRCNFATGLENGPAGVVSDFCPVTCGLCPNSPSASPSKSPAPSVTPTRSPSKKPSRAPTGLPSPSPTLSQMPSNAPTGNPTAPPTFICEDHPFNFYVQDPVNRFKPCDPWVKNNPSLRCGLTTGFVNEPVGVVSDFCPKTCGSCPNAPSVSPSKSSAPSITPTQSPSQKPSHRPSISPSQLPSIQPSHRPSILPSDQPSSEPSICLDSYWEVNYEISPGVFTLITCSNIGSFCNTNGIGTVYYNGKTASEACCVCGGSLQFSVSPSLTPSIYPSPSPSQCVDYPASSPTSWTTTHDVDGDGTAETYTCASFIDGQNCDPISTPGTGGKTASEACCACGGGNHIATAP